MPDNRNYHDDEWRYQPPGSRREEGDPEVPASLIFMEMMRRAASQPDPDAPPDHAQDSAAFADAPSVPAVPGPASPGTGEPSSAQLIAEALDTPPRQDYDTAREVHRVRRVKRRQARRRTRRVGLIGGFTRTVLVAVIAAGLMATIFSFWTDPRYFKAEVRAELQVALATDVSTPRATGMPTPPWLRRIGIVSGHRGPENDPGAVCPDGLTEREINFNVAQLVVRNLRGRGYSVDLLDEFDPRLNNYQAAALISIHSNTCQDWGGEIVSGYLVAKAAARPEGGPDVTLAECIADHYGQLSQLERRIHLTVDMTEYHTFREIHPLTPAAIIELGFMLADRALLTEQPDLLARGVTDGILCFLEPGMEPPTEAPPPG